MTTRARYSIHGIPNDIVTNDFIDKRRIKVEDADPAYALGQQFRISYPLEVSNGDTVFLRVISPVDFELVAQNVETHQRVFIRRPIQLVHLVSYMCSLCLLHDSNLLSFLLFLLSCLCSSVASRLFSFVLVLVCLRMYVSSSDLSF